MTEEAALEIPDGNFAYLLWRRLRRELLERPGFVLGTLAALILLAGIFYWPIRVTKYGKLTDMEQMLFQLFLVALSGAISWVLAKRKEEQNVLTKQKALARSAVRRIASIAAASGRLAEITELRKVEMKSASEWNQINATQRILLYELVAGLSRQIAEMRDNIEASEGDWRDILPEEFAKKQQAETEILKAREAAIKEQQRALEELQKVLLQGEARTAQEIAALKETFASQLSATAESLSVKVEQIRSREPTSFLSSYSTMPNITIGRSYPISYNVIGGDDLVPNFQFGPSIQPFNIVRIDGREEAKTQQAEKADSTVSPEPKNEKK
jgi:hypothetical protein